MTDTARTPPHAAPNCDLFCQVIDNYGDAGFAWRLARALHAERGWRVRLFIDRPATLASLVPALGAGAGAEGLESGFTAQSVDGVEVLPWDRALAARPAGIVIEAFGCRLPDTYLERMAAEAAPHAWINLEYLSAEPWVRGCHARPSPHPRLPLTKHFFFPGFEAGTGGVLIERGLEQERLAFRADPAERAATLAALGADPHAPFTIFLFCYPEAPLAALAQALAASPQPSQWLLAPGAAREFASLAPPQARCVALPFVPQADFDRLLWSVDLALVRGEDSFVRAQLAAVPFVWQAYPQAEGAHLAKLEAFARLYADGLGPAPAAAWLGFSRAWNEGTMSSATWDALRASLPELAIHAASWRGRLASLGSLADALGSFAEARLK
jgi:uncharacterized repeat protein (TIGR03837 family)